MSPALLSSLLVLSTTYRTRGSESRGFAQGFQFAIQTLVSATPTPANGLSQA